MKESKIDPIDRNELRSVIEGWIRAHYDVDDADGVDLLEDVLWEINAQATLAEENKPLTLEQLKEIGDRAVWVEVIDREHTNICTSGWCVVDFSFYKDESIADVWWPGSEVQDIGISKDYWKTWVAYKEKPSIEEEYNKTD